MVAPIGDEYLKDAAAGSGFTKEELQETADNLHQVIQNDLNDHFKRSRLESGMNYWLIEEFEGVWLAFTRFRLVEQMRKAEIEYEREQVIAVGYAYLERFQDSGLTIEVPGPVMRQLKDPFFLPILVRYPEDWKNGELHTFQRFHEFVLRYNMTSAEALDYWAVERMNQKPIDWAAKRDVEPEAVRKNVRQANEKLADEDLGASHERTALRPVQVEDVPSGDPHDAENDLFYIPTDESLEELDSHSEGE